MNIYTKNGDKGKTSLIGGKIVSKHDIRVDSYGSIDELNSFLGLVRDYSSKKEINDILFKIQCKLFTIGSLIAQENAIKNNSNEKLNINANDTEYLETKIDAFVQLMRPLGLKEVSRTGIAAIARGPEAM